MNKENVETTKLLSKINDFKGPWLDCKEFEEADEMVIEFLIELKEMCGDYSDTSGN